jgi:dimethylamine/trimethylamine dehydrogenase
MLQAVVSGQVDIIGAARPSIADPFLPNKIQEGRLDEIRECIGCNICTARSAYQNHLACTQNATAGEEYRRGWHPEKFDLAENADNDVLIVGAGPAGMECAIVLGKRGMRRVHLVEAQDDMGGIMRWIPRLPGLGEWARVVNYRKIQIDKLRNVEFIPNTQLDARGVAEYGGEIVVIATGASWATDGLNGGTHDNIPGADASQPWQLTPEQIMHEGKDTPGERVVVIDNDGYFMGVSLAEKLALEGKQVTFMTHFRHIAPFMDFTLEARNQHRRLQELRVTIATYQAPTQIAQGKVTSAHVYDEERLTEWDADAIVLVTQRRSNEMLYRELKDNLGIDALRAEGITGLYRIGDCEAPRLVADSIFSGHRLGREIDSENPDLPRPFIRENRVLGWNDDDYKPEQGGPHTSYQSESAAIRRNQASASARS